MNKKNIVVPNLPESISDAIVAVWHKKIGEDVKQGEILVELETDKIMLEVPAEESGMLQKILENVGTIVISGQVLGVLLLESSRINENKCVVDINNSLQDLNKNNNILEKKENNHYIKSFTPSIRRYIKKYDLNPELILKNDFHKYITRESFKKNLNNDKCFSLEKFSISQINQCDNRSENRVPMTRLRERVAERLLEVIHNTAMLTTFNEINMKPIINLRKKFGDIFEKQHGVRLGFMSFFVKAVLEGLKSFPEINASIDGKEIVYYNYFDINIAISTSRGLVTPVLKNVNLLNIAEIEKEIKNMAIKGRDGKLKIEELSGGNFTITNGGVFGSLMSTPIINPPQSAILGMHAIKERPMAVDGKIKILPMMYLALSYDHRLIDGKDSIGFLMKVKSLLEDPMQFLLNI